MPLLRIASRRCAPLQMVTERDKVSSTQAYLNLVVETLAEKVANKEVFANVTRHQRSYYRSIYDIADWSQWREKHKQTRVRSLRCADIRCLRVASDLCSPLHPFWPFDLLFFPPCLCFSCCRGA